MKKLTSIAIAAVGLGFSYQGAAETLTNLQVFSRCYSQITQKRLPDNHALVAAVQAGTKGPIDACMEVFDKAKFSALTNTRIANTNDVEAKAVLQTLHKVHTSWFDKKDVTPVASTVASAGLADILDNEIPAMHFTRALFKPNADIREVLTGTISLKPIRTNMDPTQGPKSKRPKTDHIFRASTVFAAMGELFGIRTLANNELLKTYSYLNSAGTEITGPANLGTHLGGGILGEQIYLVQNFGLGFQANSDGAEVVPRRLGRAIFNDLLCRTLPVIRSEDATPFVLYSPGPLTASFRTSSGCTRCHASMDRISSVARNLEYFSRAALGANLGFEIMINRGPVAGVAAETAWPSQADANYFKRPPNGVLYFRNQRGTLVNRNVTSLGTLGTAITEQDDFYSCAAKRYYRYFTGIDVDIGDVDDPSAGIFLSPRDIFHRNRVLQLGADLRTSRSTRDLIERILRLPSYSRSDFGAGLSQ